MRTVIEIEYEPRNTLRSQLSPILEDLALFLDNSEGAFKDYSGTGWTATVRRADAAAVSAPVGAGSREGEGAHVISEHRAELGFWWCGCKCGWKDFHAYAKRENAMAAFESHVAAATGEAPFARNESADGAVTYHRPIGAVDGDAAPTEAGDLENDIQVWFSKAEQTVPNRILLAILMDMARRIEARNGAPCSAHRGEAAPAATGDLRGLRRKLKDWDYTSTCQSEQRKLHALLAAIVDHIGSS